MIKVAITPKGHRGIKERCDTFCSNSVTELILAKQSFEIICANIMLSKYCELILYN